MSRAFLRLRSLLRSARGRRECLPRWRSLSQRERLPQARVAYVLFVGADGKQQSHFVWNDVALRAAMGACGERVGLFDLGPSRRRYEEIWTADLSEALATFLLTLPPPFRAYAKRELHRKIDNQLRTGPLVPWTIPALWAEISSSMGHG